MMAINGNVSAIVAGLCNFSPKILFQNRLKKKMRNLAASGSPE